MPKRRIIIDTDPGVDDILALLLAFSSPASELEVLLISLTFGNIEIRKCLHNAMSVFHVIEKELAWRRERGVEAGFEALRAHRPIVACGADRSLDRAPVDAGYFHGTDGLGDVHTKCPHLSADGSYEALFAPTSADGTAASVAELQQEESRLYTPSRELAHREMLRLLRENEAGSITIVAVGPLTNLALAAEEDLETFLRAKEVVIMGGAIDEPGNVTPFAEFNVFADPVAAARVFALTSRQPRISWPRMTSASTLRDMPPARLSDPLKLKMAPLDLTHQHNFTPTAFRAAVNGLVGEGSPMAELVSTVVEHTFSTIRRLRLARQGVETMEGEEEMSLHDPVCVWYVLTSEGGWRWKERDVRVETNGQWTRGMTAVDRRATLKEAEAVDRVEVVEADSKGKGEVEVDVEGKEEEDDRGWWRVGANRVGVLEEGPGHLLSEELLRRVFRGRT